MAIACLRPVTFFPLLPLLSVPRLRLRIARSTPLDAPREYRRAFVMSLTDYEMTRFARRGMTLMARDGANDEEPTHRELRSVRLENRQDRNGLRPQSTPRAFG